MPSGGRGERIPLEIQGRAGRVEGILIYNSEATFRKAKFSKGGSPGFRDVIRVSKGESFSFYNKIF